MRIGILLDPWLTPRVGGGYTFTRETVAAMVRAAGNSRHELVLLTWSVPHWDFPPAKNVHVLSLDALDKAGVSPEVAAPGADELLRQAGVEFLWNPSCLTALTLEIPYATPVWDMQHRLQPFFPEVSAGGEWQRRERNYRELLGRAAVVVVGTQAGQQELERFYGLAPERFARLPHPTPADCLAPRPGPQAAAKTWQRLGLEPGYLFYPAQFWPHKNHTGLLAALKILKQDHGLAPALVLTGSEHGNRAHIARLADELGLAEQVRLPGFLERAEILDLYEGAGALAYVSHFGPENLPPLEAFALGCPVLAADVPGAREQLGACALLSDPRDPAALAAGLARLLRDQDLCRELTTSGLKRAQGYSSEDFAREALAVCDGFESFRRCWA